MTDHFIFYCSTEHLLGGHNLAPIDPVIGEDTLKMKLHDGEGFKSSLKPAQRTGKPYDVKETATITLSHTGRQIPNFMILSSTLILCYV